MSIHRLLALFDLFSKSPNSTNPSSDIEEIRLLLPILRRTSTYIERAGKLRSLPDDSGITRKLSIQLDQAIEQIRATFNRFMRTPTTAPNSSQSTTRLRSDQLVTQAGTDKPVQSNVILNEVHKLVRESLNAIVGVVERSTTSRMEDQQCRIGEVEQRDLNLRTAAVDTLILLAHDSLVILDRSTHTAVFIYLSRALPLLKLPSNSHDPDSIDLEASYSIHSLATTLYNIGIWLYEAGMADAAIRFGREACLLTREALETFAKEADDESDGLFERMNTLKLDGEEEEDDERRDSRIDEDSKREKTREEKKLVRTELEKNVGRRWNLLALAHHTIGDRQVSLLLMDPIPPSLLMLPQSECRRLMNLTSSRSFLNLRQFCPLSKQTRLSNRFRRYSNHIALCSKPSIAQLESELSTSSFRPTRFHSLTLSPRNHRHSLPLSKVSFSNSRSLLSINFWKGPLHNERSPPSLLHSTRSTQPGSTPLGELVLSSEGCSICVWGTKSRKISNLQHLRQK